MFKKLATSLGLASPEPPTAVTIQVGKQTYKVSFERSDFQDETRGVTVGYLRQKVAEVSQTPVSGVTMVYGGKKLSNDGAYLLDYGVHTDAKILVLSSKRPPAKPAAAPKKAAPKVSPQAQVDEVLNGVDKNFEKPLKQFIDTTPKSIDVAADEHRRLSETVLQQILKLDNVDVSSSQELRQYRKGAINKLHNLHERIDQAFEQKKAEFEGGKKTDGAKSVGTEPTKTVAAASKEPALPEPATGPGPEPGVTAETTSKKKKNKKAKGDSSEKGASKGTSKAAGPQPGAVPEPPQSEPVEPDTGDPSEWTTVESKRKPKATEAQKKSS